MNPKASELARLLIHEATLPSYSGWWWINRKLYDTMGMEHWDWAARSTGRMVFRISDDEYKSFEDTKSVDHPWRSILVDRVDPIRIAIVNGRTVVAQIPDHSRKWYDELLDALLKIGKSKITLIRVGIWADANKHPGKAIELDGQEFLAGNIVKI